MLKKVLSLAAIFALLSGVYAFVIAPDARSIPELSETEELVWHSWEEAVELAKKDKKKILVDVYTDWCGWCKRMDKATFTNEDIITYLNKHFYAVKLDAEQKEDIIFDGYTFKFKPQGRRGAHELAIQLLDGRMSYPSLVYLTGDFEIISRSPGYKAPDALLKELTYIGGEHYTNTSWQDYSKSK
jgi:thioredoxin-related protein